MPLLPYAPKRAQLWTGAAATLLAVAGTPAPGTGQELRLDAGSRITAAPDGASSSRAGGLLRLGLVLWTTTNPFVVEGAVEYGRASVLPEAAGAPWIRAERYGARFLVTLGSVVLPGGKRTAEPYIGVGAAYTDHDGEYDGLEDRLGGDVVGGLFFDWSAALRPFVELGVGLWSDEPSYSLAAGLRVNLLPARDGNE